MLDDSKNAMNVSPRAFPELPHALHKFSVASLVCGILLALLGLFSIANAFYATAVTVGIIGGVLIAGGLVQAAQAILSRKWKSFLLHVLVAILYVVAGVMVFSNPVATALSVSLLVASFLIVGGIFKILASAAIRFDQWAWTAFSGLASLVLGALIFAQWPTSALWILGLMVGIELLFMGISLIAAAFAARREEASLDDSPLAV